jgi:hypothetical protein
VLSSPVHIRKTIAAFLLVAFLFIHAEKLCHAHPCTTSHDHEQTAIFKSTSSVCAICEFQLSRNAELTPAEKLPIPGVQEVKDYFSFQCDIFSDYFSSFSGRGPPSLITA